MIRLRVPGIVLLGITIVAALVPLVRGVTDLPTAEHHLLHAALIAGALISALLLTEPRKAENAHYGWLLAAVLSPIAAMMLMWPSEYAWFERHPLGHVLEHLGIVGCGFASGYAGQMYASGVGWVTGLSLLGMSVASAWGFGVAPAPAAAVLAAATTTAPQTSAAAGTTGATNIAHGAVLFSQNCAMCHGARGTGGVGPSLVSERTRKDFQQAQQWIMKPDAPMPTLFPGTLSRSDVRDVAAFVETL